MTTYLATVTTWSGSPELDEITIAFCSPLCREASAYRDGWIGGHTESETYEFHERCHYCDDLILASWILAASPVFDLESIRIAAAAATTPSSKTWSGIRRALAHEFTRPS